METTYDDGGSGLSWSDSITRVRIDCLKLSAEEQGKDVLVMLMVDYHDQFVEFAKENKRDELLPCFIQQVGFYMIFQFMLSVFPN